MHRIDTATADANANGTGKAGFTEGNPGLGVPPTQLNASWFNAIQEEICNVIESNGGTLSGSYTQLLSALRSPVGVTTNPAIDATGGSGGGIGMIGRGVSSAAGLRGIGGSSAGEGIRGIGGTGGDGVVGTGNAAGAGGSFTAGATGYGVTGIGGSSSGHGGRFQSRSSVAGVYGDNTSSGPGVEGLGGTGGDGVKGTGGATSGKGGNFTGTGSGTGVVGTGGATGPGGTFVGGGSQWGAKGTGGSSDGTGLIGQGGASNGIGVEGDATGTAAGVYGKGIDGPGVKAESDTTSPARAALYIVPQDAAPSSPSQGHTYVHSTTGKLGVYNGNGNDRYVPQSFAATSDESKDNTSGTQNFTSSKYTIPANTLRAGSTIRVRASGIIASGTDGGNVSLAILFGSRTIALTQTRTAASNDVFVLDAWVTMQAAGASAAMRAGSIAMLGQEAQLGTANVDTGPRIDSANVDTTAAIDVKLQVVWATVAMSNTATLHTFIVDVT